MSMLVGIAICVGLAFFAPGLSPLLTLLAFAWIGVYWFVFERREGRDTMRARYDFSSGVRGKYAKDYAKRDR